MHSPQMACIWYPPRTYPEVSQLALRQLLSLVVCLTQQSLKHLADFPKQRLCLQFEQYAMLTPCFASAVGIILASKAVLKGYSLGTDAVMSIRKHKN